MRGGVSSMGPKNGEDSTEKAKRTGKSESKNRWCGEKKATREPTQKRKEWQTSVKSRRARENVKHERRMEKKNGNVKIYYKIKDKIK